jgi:uncharacterized protein (DUF1330 family)
MRLIAMNRRFHARVLGGALAHHRSGGVQEIYRPGPAIIARYGGRVLARGGRFQIMEGADKFHRSVVIEFDTFEQGVACFQSPEYEEAAAFRRNGAGEVETIMVEGGDATTI